MKKKAKRVSLWANKKIRRLLWFSLTALILLQFPAENIYFHEIKQGEGLVIKKEIYAGEAPLLPVNRTHKMAPELTAAGVVVKDIDSGLILYKKNENARFPPASTTKIVTALVGLDNYKLEDILTVKSVVNTPRIMGLVGGEQLTFESLLYGALVHSANDAALTIAGNYQGGIDNFIKAMNTKVKQLGLTNTRFANPMGFDDDNQYTTASDLTRLALLGLNDKTFKKIVGTKSITVSDVNYTNFHTLTSVNELLGKVAGVTGVKTGFTQNAGEVLVSEVKKNNHAVLFVILKSDDRFGETIKLINWVYDNFDYMPFTPNLPDSLQ